MMFFQFLVILISYNLLFLINILTSVNAAFNVAPAYSGNDQFLVAEYWKRLEVKCKIEDGPNNITIKWLKDGKTLDPSEWISIEGNTVIILRVRETDGGDYQCQVFEGSNQTPSKNATVVVKFKPYTYVKEDDQTFIEESPMNITCYVRGKPREVKWRFENESRSPVEKKVTYFEFEGVKNAKMHIKSANKTDRGFYFCYPETEGLPHEETKIRVRVRGKYAALLPFLGICAEVLVLCAVIFIYEKRRDKTELEESDTDQGPEIKSSPDQHRTDSIRQRK